MKQSTIKNYLKLLLDIKESNKTIKKYCIDNGINYNSVISTISSIRKKGIKDDNVNKLISIYDAITTRNKAEKIDNDNRSEIAYIRDENNQIKFYEYKIYRRNKAPLSGKLTREEMNTIHRLYSYYGDSLTQRSISRHFVDLSLVDFKRILRAFNITKASAPFAPHMIEECDENTLREIQLREKENSFLRKAEEDLIKNNEKLLKKYAQENIELKNKLNSLSDFRVTISGDVKPIKVNPVIKSDNSINLYIADMHIGASMDSGPLYDENVNYDTDEIKRRLSEVLFKLKSLGQFGTINLVLMGDNIDCCGVYGKTSRMDHDMPENMNVRDQANTYISIMVWFISCIMKNEMCSNVRVYSVPNGNHGGNFEYICNKALLATINSVFPNVETTLWEKFFGVFEQNNETFICLHGKDSRFMKKGLPLNLDDKSKIMLYEWLHDQGIHSDNVHFIKGDLHSNALSSCKRLDYRNVLSLFGASDYSNYNFGRNSYGVSYDLFIGDNLVRGTFENM